MILKNNAYLTHLGKIFKIHMASSSTRSIEKRGIIIFVLWKIFLSDFDITST
jgi:hypothetical protein